MTATPTATRATGQNSSSSSGARRSSSSTRSSTTRLPRTSRPRLPPGLEAAGRLVRLLLGDGHPGDHVGDHPEPVGQGEDDEGDPQQHRVDPEVAPDPAAPRPAPARCGCAAPPAAPVRAARSVRLIRSVRVRGSRAHPLEHKSCGCGHDTAMTNDQPGPAQLPLRSGRRPGPRGHAILGADRFLKALEAAELPFVVLTNNSIYTPRPGGAVDPDRDQPAAGPDSTRPWPPPSSSTASARVAPRYRRGWVDHRPARRRLHPVRVAADLDYVVLGETRTYSFELITQGHPAQSSGACFIATNPDPIGPSWRGRRSPPARWPP